jgi:hypothetical protein
MKLQTQIFIETHGLAALTDQLRIKTRRHDRFPNLVHLKYDQINSPMADPVVQECRGLILDESDGWRVVSYPFDKFFNYGEPNAAAIDWTTAAVQEKLDGSLMVLYRYAREWQVASSGSPDAGGDVWGHTGTFADLFWETWKLAGYGLPDESQPPACFMFELMTPFNRVVVPHQDSRLICIGARDLTTLGEVPADKIAAQFGWRPVRSFPLQTLDDVLTAAKALNPMDAEGFVVVDASFHRVKVKSPQYVALHHAKDGTSPGRMLEMVRSNESAEFLAYFPQLQEAFNYVQGQYAALCDELEAAYLAIKDIPGQKDFAAAALKTRSSSPLFALRANKCRTVREFFTGATLPSLERAINLDVAKVQRLLRASGVGDAN